MKTKSEFLRKAAVKAGDKTHRAKILKAITTYTGKVEGMKSAQYYDWQQARSFAEQTKNYVLRHLPDLLEQFERNITANGAQVLWAEDAAEAREHIRRIFRERKVRKVVKSKSMTTEEIEVNELLESEGIEVLESDLGELIVQLAGEKPYHIVTPAMHKSRQDIAALFHEKLGVPASSSAEELTMAARGHLRSAYVTADAGITGANFLLAEGAIVMTENEGNGRLTMSCPPVHVVIAGIEKILPAMENLALFLPLLTTSGTGQQITCYNSVVRGPRAAGEQDGPQEMIVILLDNGRSAMYAEPEFQHALRCIRCGACLNACPVYRTVGGHAYGTTYQGPIGSVITPHMRGMAEFSHLSSASSLCGACTQVCPVQIDLHHLLLKNRAKATEEKRGVDLWQVGFAGWAKVMTSRKRLEGVRRLAVAGEASLRVILPHALRKRLPVPAKKSFARQWQEGAEH